MRRFSLCRNVRYAINTPLTFCDFLHLDRIIHKLSGSLSLPNMANLSSRRRSAFDDADKQGLDWNERNSSSVLQVTPPPFCIHTALRLSRPPITCDGFTFRKNIMNIQGSLLPTSNMHLKLYTSAISSTKIQGRVVILSEKGSYASINEAISWRRVNPFSPLMDGKLITL